MDGGQHCPPYTHPAPPEAVAPFAARPKLRTGHGTQRGLSRCVLKPGLPPAQDTGVQPVGIIWTIVIGFLAGVIAKFIMPGDRNEPAGFVLTTILGIIGAFVANFLGQSLGWYGPEDGAGLIGATLGAIIVLMIFGAIRRRA
jgi:uncharacterized membrane protein YeaQ/YmgE (transglycosylase-associated protein family)